MITVQILTSDYDNEIVSYSYCKFKNVDSIL